MKKVTLLLCSFLLTALLFLLPTEAKAAEVLGSGTCGADLTWTLTDDGLLTISGTGPMDNYIPSDAPSPWDNDTRIVSIVIEEGVTSIGDYAFSNCLALEEITIADSVTSIGKYTFQRCGSLVGFTLPQGITAIPDGMLVGCGRITQFTIPDSVTSIGSEAFMECLSLTEFVIPDKVVSIGNYAFANCKYITTITIPDSVKTIGEHAFFYCASLKSLTLGSGLESIGTNCFRNVNHLSSVYVDDVADWCQIDFGFPFANPLGSATLYVAGQPLTELNIPEGVTHIGNNSFNGYTPLKSVTFSNTVTEVGDYAFNNCTNLLTVELSDSIVTLGEYAFRGCPFTSITFGEKLEKIGFAAFQYCKSLTSVTIPDSVTHIDEIAFYGCYGITDLTLGKGIAVIGPSAFEKCDALWHILYRGSTEDWNAISIDKTNSRLGSVVRHDHYTGNEQIDFVNQTCAVCACTHAWDNGAVTKEATCLESGITTHTCTLCHSVKTEPIAQLTTHTPGAPATATTDQVCTVCGAVLEKATGETEPVTEPVTPTDPADGNGQQGDSIWIIAVVAIGISVAVAIGILIRRKKAK